MIITAGPGTIDKERHGDITAVAVNDESGNISHYEWRWSDGTPLLRFEAKTPEQA